MTPNGFDFDDYTSSCGRAMTRLHGAEQRLAVELGDALGRDQHRRIGNRKMVFDNGFGIRQEGSLGTAPPTSGAYSRRAT